VKKQSYLLFSRFGVIFIFCPFIYYYKQFDFDFKVIGFVTPIGGSLLIVALAYYFQLLKKKNNKVRIIKWYIKY
jgi:uncharacterized membrane protein YgdD (TMEM256/DUF423 family)